MNFAYTFLALVLIPACSVATSAPEAPAKIAARTDGGAMAADSERRQVLVEIAILRVSPDFAAPAAGQGGGTTLERLLEDPRVNLVSTPHILADDGHQASMEVGTDGTPGTRLVVTPTIDPSNRIHLDLDLSINDSAGPPGVSARRLMTKTEVTLGDHQLLVGALQSVPSIPSERWIYTLDARIIRSQADLRKILDEKQKRGDESVRRPKGG